MHFQQIEEEKTKKVEIEDEVKVLTADKFAISNKLEGLMGLPEKYRKQVVSRTKCF